jgi:hypothetical protein
MLDNTQRLLSSDGFLCEGGCEQRIPYPDGTSSVKITYHMDGSIISEVLDLERKIPGLEDF